MHITSHGIVGLQTIHPREILISMQGEAASDADAM